MIPKKRKENSKDSQTLVISGKRLGFYLQLFQYILYSKTQQGKSPWDLLFKACQARITVISPKLSVTQRNEN